MFALQGKKQGSRYDYKNDMQRLLRLVEDVRDPAFDEEGEICVSGFLPLEEINRIRKMAKMEPLSQPDKVAP